MSISYLDRVFSFFGINKENEVKALPKSMKYYQIKHSEIQWAVKKIISNRAKYVAKFGDDWIEGALLHFVVMRLNYSKLHQLKTRALSEYTEHYYFEAAMTIKNVLEATWKSHQA